MAHSSTAMHHQHFLGSWACLPSYEHNCNDVYLATSKWQHPVQHFLVKTAFLKYNIFSDLFRFYTNWMSIFSHNGAPPSFHFGTQNRSANKLQSTFFDRSRSLYSNHPVKGKKPWLSCIKWLPGNKELHSHMFPEVFLS